MPKKTKKQKYMSSKQITLNVINVESKISIENIIGNQNIEQRTIVPPTDYINLQLMIHSFWKVSVKGFNFFSLRNSLPKKIWANEKNVFLYTHKQRLSLPICYCYQDIGIN